MPRRPIPLVRTSERLTFKRCRQQWAWAYIDGYSGDLGTPAQRFGDLVHRSLAEYYKPGARRGPHPAKVFQRLYAEAIAGDGGFSLRDEDERLEAGELGVAMLEHYVETYGRDDDLLIIAPEMPFKVKLRDAGGEPFYYVGRFDAMFVRRSTNEAGILETKTTTSIGDGKALALDEQAGSYWVFAPWWVEELRRRGVIKGRHALDLDMILYNFLRKAPKDLRPRNEDGYYLNKDGSVSKSQPPPYFARIPVYRDADDRRAVLRRIRLEAFEMRMVREGKLPIYKNPASGYPDRHCESCPYRDMCELHETGSDWREYGRMAFTRIDPYDQYMIDLGLKEAS